MHGCRRHLLVVSLVVLVWASAASADAVFLKDQKEPLHGQIVDETEDAFLIEVPKDRVTKIEREAPFVRRSAAATPRAEHRAIVETSSSLSPSAEASALSRHAAEPPPPVAGVPTTPPGPADRRLGSIAGRVLWDSVPLTNCKIKAVMVSSSQPLAMVSKLLGHTEAYAGEDGFVVETITDASGRYRVAQVPPGEYDIYWQPSGQPDSQWIRRLREKPDLVVLDGESATYPDIEAHVKTRN